MELRPLFDLIDKRPFRPFVVELLNGKSVPVNDPDRIALIPGRQKVMFIIVTYPEEDDYRLFWPDGIAACRPLPPDGDGDARPSP